MYVVYLLTIKYLLYQIYFIFLVEYTKSIFQRKISITVLFTKPNTSALCMSEICISRYPSRQRRRNGINNKYKYYRIYNNVHMRRAEEEAIYYYSYTRYYNLSGVFVCYIHGGSEQYLSRSLNLSIFSYILLAVRYNTRDLLIQQLAAQGYNDDDDNNDNATRGVDVKISSRQVVPIKRFVQPITTTSCNVIGR